MKQINLNDTVFNLCSNNPELADILKELGFEKAVNPLMLKTVGRFMTLKKGAKLKKIDLEIIKEKLLSCGFDAVEE